MARDKPFIEVRQAGFKEIDKYFAQMGRAATKQILTAGMRTAAKPMVADAQRMAPKQTAEGAKSIKIRAGKPFGRTLVRLTLGPDRNHFYLMFHEFGTFRLPADPFLRPAWDKNIAAFIKNFGRDLGKALEKKGDSLVRAVNKGKLSRSTKRSLGI